MKKYSCKNFLSKHFSEFQNYEMFVKNLEDFVEENNKKFTEKAKTEASELLKFLKNKHALRYIAMSHFCI